MDPGVVFGWFMAVSIKKLHLNSIAFNCDKRYIKIYLEMKQIHVVQ